MTVASSTSVDVDASGEGPVKDSVGVFVHDDAMDDAVGVGDGV